MPTTPKRSALGRHAASVRWQRDDQIETARDLAAARIEEYVERIVSSAPPLTDEQATRIVRLLGLKRGDAA